MAISSDGLICFVQNDENFSICQFKFADSRPPGSHLHRIEFHIFGIEFERFEIGGERLERDDGIAEYSFAAAIKINANRIIKHVKIMRRARRRLRLRDREKRDGKCKKNKEA